MPRKTGVHALLSASASYRWLHCTAAPRFEERFPDDEQSVYAAEGTLAHRFCEELVRYNFHEIRRPEFESRWNALRQEPIFQEEMIKTAEFYGHYLWERFLTFERKAFVSAEVKVDLREWIPEGKGTCDCVMIGNGHLHITDYKHGKGVQVSAKCNTQMRLYALGALWKYRPVYGDSIKTVSMAIVQPRITEEVDEETLTVEELLAWGESVKPVAQKAYTGRGEFLPGDWCRFCKGRNVCRARSQNATAFEEFKDLQIEGQLSPEEIISREQADGYGADLPPALSDREVADLIRRGAWLVDWYNGLKEYALNAILSGCTIPGYNVVEGQARRKFSDPSAAWEVLRKAGYPDALICELKSPAKLEKALTKKKFDELAGQYVILPQGKPALAEETDKRPPFSSAEKDFHTLSGLIGRHK